MAQDQGPKDAVTVVRSFVSAYNADAVDDAAEHYADGARRDVKPDAMKEDAPFQGKDEIRRWIESDKAKNTRVEVDVDRVHGDTVEATARVWSDKFAQLQVEQPMVATETYVVNQGKIVEHVTTFDEESVGRIRDAVSDNT